MWTGGEKPQISLRKKYSTYIRHVHDHIYNLLGTFQRNMLAQIPHNVHSIQ